MAEPNISRSQAYFVGLERRVKALEAMLREKSNIRFASIGDVQLVLAADTSNIDENANSSIRFEQDGGTVSAELGLTSANALEFTTSSLRWPNAPGNGEDLVNRDYVLGLSAIQSAFTTITAATNFTVTGSVYRVGTMAGVSVSVTRTTSNVGASSAIVGTFAAGGRGTFSGYTQVLGRRSSGSAALDNARCWIDVSTGEVSIQWLATWNAGVNVTFNGVVLFG